MSAPGIGKYALWTVVAAAVFVLAALQFSRFGFRAGNNDPVILQSYEVPREFASELHKALASAMFNNGASMGQVSLLPDGHILVAAPVSVQGNVRSLMREINDNKPGPTPTIGFDAWIVRATPGKDANTSANLVEIESALAVIRKSKGALEFALVEKLSLVTRSGLGDSKVRGAQSQMEVEASLRKAEGDQKVVAAKIEIEVGATPGEPANGTALEAQTELKPGELLVIGQSAVSGPQGARATDAQVYYIVRATL